MTFTGSRAPEPGCCFDSKLKSLGSIFRAQAGRNPQRENPTETLDVGHPGHTFDFERDFGRSR
jgi:hypothetical protein